MEQLAAYIDLRDKVLRNLLEFIDMCLPRRRALVLRLWRQLDHLDRDGQATPFGPVHCAVRAFPHPVPRQLLEVCWVELSDVLVGEHHRHLRLPT